MMPGDVGLKNFVWLSISRLCLTGARRWCKPVRPSAAPPSDVARVRTNCAGPMRLILNAESISAGDQRYHLRFIERGRDVHHPLHGVQLIDSDLTRSTLNRFRMLAQKLVDSRRPKLEIRIASQETQRWRKLLLSTSARRCVNAAVGIERLDHARQKLRVTRFAFLFFLTKKIGAPIRRRQSGSLINLSNHRD